MKIEAVKKRRARAFTFTLSLCLLVFSLAYGLSVVYVNTSNAINEKQIEVLSIKQTGFDEAEISVLGKNYEIKIDEPKSIPAILYALIPTNIRLMFSGLDLLADALNIPE